MPRSYQNTIWLFFTAAIQYIHGCRHPLFFFSSFFFLKFMFESQQLILCHKMFMVSTYMENPAAFGDRRAILTVKTGSFTMITSFSLQLHKGYRNTQLFQLPIAPQTKNMQLQPVSFCWPHNTQLGFVKCFQDFYSHLCIFKAVIKLPKNYMTKHSLSD